MKTITPTKTMNAYMRKDEQFTTTRQLQSFIRKNGTPDYVAVNGLLYTMHEYDNDGQQITYYNKRADNMIYVDTVNRYDKTGNGTKDAKVYIVKDFGYYRNDITFID